MNKMIVSFLAAAFASATPASHATATHVSRCSGADGSSVYTDGSCRAIGAQAVPMSASLLRSLVREGSPGSAATGNAQGQATVALRRGPGEGRPNPRAGQCARTPAQLAAALRSSLSGGDVNELASIYDWAGMSGRQARPVLEKLERMSDRPLIDGHFFNTSLQGGGNANGNDSGVVQLVQGANSAPTVTELAVRQRAGCLFLAF